VDTGDRITKDQIQEITKDGPMVEFVQRGFAEISALQTDDFHAHWRLVCADVNSSCSDTTCPYGYECAGEQCYTAMDFCTPNGLPAYKSCTPSASLDAQDAWDNRNPAILLGLNSSTKAVEFMKDALAMEAGSAIAVVTDILDVYFNGARTSDDSCACQDFAKKSLGNTSYEITPLDWARCVWTQLIPDVQQYVSFKIDGKQFMSALMYNFKVAIPDFQDALVYAYKALQPGTYSGTSWNNGLLTMPVAAYHAFRAVDRGAREVYANLMASSGSTEHVEALVSLGPLVTMHARILLLLMATCPTKRNYEDMTSVLNNYINASNDLADKPLAMRMSFISAVAGKSYVDAFPNPQCNLAESLEAPTSSEQVDKMLCAKMHSHWVHEYYSRFFNTTLRAPAEKLSHVVSLIEQFFKLAQSRSFTYDVCTILDGT